MKKLIFALLFVTSIAYGQGTSTTITGTKTQNDILANTKGKGTVTKHTAGIEVKNDSVKTIPAYEVMIKTLSGFEKEIQAVQEKQRLYLKAVLESYNYDFETAKNLHFEQGKFIFIIEKPK